MLAATVVSPHGLANLTFPLRLTSMTTLSGIGEWAPLNFNQNPYFEVALLGLVFVLGWRVRVPIFLRCCSSQLVVASHALPGCPPRPTVRDAAPCFWRTSRRCSGMQARPPGRWGRWSMATGIVLIVVVASVRIAVASGPPESVSAPAAALARVPPDLRGRPVFNAYRFGGFLIFSGVRPYIDSRAEVYGDTFRDQFPDAAGRGRVRVRGRGYKRVRLDHPGARPRP